ncbi:Interferon-inducible GTPase 1 [Microtus ochrogaster]|uniref:Interferon-inducible GTPase 1 n=1 Tax=Microtus ochrogaster TaxID=79684 RepID=A0A8J6L346_MICOH|nr:Interferon-inducible GTPase 1 [Microtus ochrogaster]
MSQLLSDASKEEDVCKYFKMIKEENRIISQKTITPIELHLAQGNIQKTNNVITDSLREISSTSLNIAVIGESGTGKSSFINAFRGIGHEEENSAPIGVVETTMRRTPYKHPKIPNVVIWDLPGIGTTNFPPKDYLEKMKFNEYDFFIIVSATRFKKNDIDLAIAVSMMKKDFYFVRTKVDIDLETEKGCKHAFGRENLLQQIQRHCVDTFKKNNLHVPPIFLISNKNSSDYDFPILKDMLKNNLSTPTLPNFMYFSLSKAEAVIERKRESMHRFIWLETIKNEAWTSLSVKGILKDSDMEKLKVILNHYRKLFGVDDGTLKLMAKDSQVPVEKLKKVIKSPYLLDTKKRETLEGKLLKYLERFASANGGLLATGLYFRKTFYLKLLFLDTVAEDAKVVLRETYSKISSNSHHPQLLTTDRCYSFLVSLTGFVVVCFVLSYLRLWTWNEV